METAGTGFSSGAASLPNPDSAACTLLISIARSEIATLLLLTCAATISAVRVTSISLVSACSDMGAVPIYSSQKNGRRIGPVFFVHSYLCHFGDNLAI